jgi:ATP-dependent Clp protease ATP-binding subunit ClpA
MPAFSQGLEKALHQALTFANERHHEYATLEHLLLALIDDGDASAVMRACNVDLDELKQTVLDYIDTELDNLVTGYDEDSKPTAGFQRVIQRAVIHVQSSGARKCPAPTCSSPSSPSARATPPISCRNSR